jgi:hypothetical protein
MRSRLKMTIALIAAGLFTAGLLVAMTHPVSSKDRKAGHDPNNGIVSMGVGL